MSDRRRLLGPPNTIIPNVGVLADTEVHTTEKDPNSIRPFFVKTGIIANANGLAYLEVGKTIIQVQVYGPRPIRGSFIERASFMVECKFLPHLFQPHEVALNGTDLNANTNTCGSNWRQGLTNIEQRILTYLETALLPSVVLEKYPKSTIDVFVTVLAMDNVRLEPEEHKTLLFNLIGWAVNCASLALVDSGIEIKDIVTSGNIRYDPQNKHTEFDADNGKEGMLDALVSFMNLRNDEIVGLWLEGYQQQVSSETCQMMIEGCVAMAKQVRATINSYLVTLAQELLESRESESVKSDVS